MIVRGVVLGFNCQRQRLNRAQVEPGHVFYVLLLGFQFAEVEAIGPINDVHRRHDHQRGLPSNELIELANSFSYAGANQVIRERPEIAFLPDASRLLLFRQADHG